MNPLEWLRKNKNRAVLWRCTNCDSFKVRPEHACMCNRPHALSKNVKLYAENDIEEALKQGDKHGNGKAKKIL